MQGELFRISGSGVEASRTTTSAPSRAERFLISLRLDHLAIVAILALVLYVLVFSFGVEKGKRFALEEIQAQREKQEQIAKELGQQSSTESLASETRMEAASVGGSPPPGDQAAHQEPNPTPPVPVPTAASLRKYTIQLITFTSRSRAEKEIEKFRGKGYQGFIIPSGKFFQVCIEAFETTQEAREKLLVLRSEGLASADAYVRPLKGTLAF